MRVSILFAVADRMVIREGAVPPGMPLLVTGNERVFPTQPLMILNPEAMETGDGGGRGAPESVGRGALDGSAAVSMEGG